MFTALRATVWNSMASIAQEKLLLSYKPDRVLENFL
jgi:hypothetical protein